MIETTVYKLSASAYMRQLFPLYMRKRWWIPAVVVTPFLLLSFVDVRFVYVALMMAFFVMPMLFGYVYFYYALSEECVSSIRKCKVVFEADGVKRIFYDDDNAVVGTNKRLWIDYQKGVVDESGVRLFLKGKSFSFDFIPDTALLDEKKSRLEELIHNVIV